MASRRRKKKPFREPVRPVRKSRSVPVAAVVFFAGVVAAAMLFNLSGCGAKSAKDSTPGKSATGTGAKDSVAPSAAVKPPTEVAAPKSQPSSLPLPGADTTASGASTASNAKPGLDVLKGKWRRPDGGYVVDIKGIDASGKMDASYANPRPIHVAEAKASQDGSGIKVFIELRDVNYPGSTYTLTYDPKSDELRGIYYQAALQQQFEVFFERLR